MIVKNSSEYSTRQLYTIKTFGTEAMVGENKMALHCGCMGCGKTRSLMEAFGIYSCFLQSLGYKNLNFILLGRTQNAVKKNMCNVLANIFGNDFSYDRSLKDGISKDATLFGQNLYIVGLNDATAETKIRGISDVIGVIHDEAVLCTKDQFDLILSRLRGGPDLPHPYVKNWYIGSTNPDSPEHFLLKYIKQGIIKLIQWYATDVRWAGFDTYFARQKRLYRRNRAFWDRFIRGRWTGSDLIVYQSFQPKEHIIRNAEADLTQFKRVFMSLDYGSNHPTAVHLIAYAYSGQYIVLKEWKYQRTAPSNIVHDILAEMDYVCKIIKQDKLTIYVDPSAVAIKDELKKNSIFPLDAKNNHVAGIGFVDSLFATDRLYIFEECENTIVELGTYKYKPGSNGKDGNVVKIDDDFADSLRYGVYSDATYNNN